MNPSHEIVNVNPLGVEVGDYVHFGGYGALYVVDLDYMMNEGKTWWVTDNKDERFNRNARGWSICSHNAKKIIEKGDESDE